MVETIGIEPMQNTGLQPVALPTELNLHVGAEMGLEPTVLAVKERCLSHLTNEPCWRMAQDLNLWSSTNDFSLAKRHNKPLCQPSIWSSEQELNLYLSRRYDCAIVTPSLDILPPYSPCCIFRPPKDCNLDVLCLYTSILIGGRCYSVSNNSPHVGLEHFLYWLLTPVTCLSR